jgi:hypothetical protein
VTELSTKEKSRNVIAHQKKIRIGVLAIEKGLTEISFIGAGH